MLVATLIQWANFKHLFGAEDSMFPCVFSSLFKQSCSLYLNSYANTITMNEYDSVGVAIIIIFIFSAPRSIYLFGHFILIQCNCFLFVIPIRCLTYATKKKVCCRTFQGWIQNHVDIIPLNRAHTHKCIRWYCIYWKLDDNRSAKYSSSNENKPTNNRMQTIHTQCCTIYRNNLCCQSSFWVRSIWIVMYFAVQYLWDEIQTKVNFLIRTFTTNVIHIFVPFRFLRIHSENVYSFNCCFILLLLIISFSNSSYYSLPIGCYSVSLWNPIDDTMRMEENKRTIRFIWEISLRTLLWVQQKYMV